MRRRTGENCNSSNPKGVAAVELIARNYKPSKSGIRPQCRAILTVRNKNLLSSQPRVELRYSKYNLIAVGSGYFTYRN